MPGTGIEPVRPLSREILSRIIGNTPRFTKLRLNPLEQVFSRDVKLHDTPVFDQNRPGSLSLGS